VSGFDAGWLSLREDADRRARSAPLARALGEWLAQSPEAHAPCVVDLGCGTGASLRFLAPLIGGPQRWICVDDDPVLLQILQRTRVEGVSLEVRHVDLAHDLAGIQDIAAQVIVASALLDLVSSNWLDALIAHARRRQASVLFALSYDGRLELQPAHPVDEAVRAAFNAHQRRDKGFGPALGPDACETVAAMLLDAGYEVRREVSDWRIDARNVGDVALLEPLLAGIARAAAEQAPLEAARIDAWLAARREQVAARSLRLTVGHEDALGLPPPRDARRQ
jgi:SAM-dependent methyltransferase